MMREDDTDEQRSDDRHRQTIEESLDLLTRQAAEINRLATLTVKNGKNGSSEDAVSRRKSRRQGTSAHKRESNGRSRTPRRPERG
jgi:hypothetical protein